MLGHLKIDKLQTNLPIMDASLISSKKGEEMVAATNESNNKKRKLSPEKEIIRSIKTVKAAGPSAAGASSSSSSSSDSSNVIKLRKELKAKVVSALKKGTYKGNNLPVVEIVHGITDKSLAKSMMQTYLPNAEISTETKAMTKYEQMSHQDMKTLLDLPERIESNFKGKVWCHRDAPCPVIKVNCWFERVEVQIKANEIKLKGRGICDRNQTEVKKATTVLQQKLSEGVPWEEAVRASFS